MQIKLSHFDLTDAITLWLERKIPELKNVPASVMVVAPDDRIVMQDVTVNVTLDGDSDIERFAAEVKRRAAGSA